MLRSSLAVARLVATVRGRRRRQRSPVEGLSDDLLASSPLGLAFLDRELRFRRINPVLARMNGLSIEEHLGRTPMELLPGIDPEQYLPGLRAILDGGPPPRPVLVAGETHARAGEAGRWEESFYPVHGAEGQVRGIGIVAMDVTDRTAAEESLRRQEATARLILESAPNGMLLVDAQGEIVAINPEAARLFGYPPGELVGRPVEVLLPPRLHPTHPSLRESFRQDPRTRAMGHGRDLSARRKDGSEFPVEVGLAVAPGAPGLVTCVVSDISERKRVEDERARLQSVTEAGLAQLPLEELLQRVVRAFDGDSGTVLLLADDGAHLVVTAAHGLGEQLGEGRIPVGAGTVGSVARTGRPRAVEDLRRDEGHRRDEHLPPDEGHRRLLVDAGLRSLLVAPLVLEGVVIGVLHVGSCDVGRFTTGDLGLAQAVADRVALAVDRARAFDREREIAEILQRGLLPDRLPDLAGASVAVRYLPGTSGMRVGGDWYDALHLADGRVLLVIGDVMGRGVRAASVMGQLRTALRTYVQLELPLPDVVARLNGTVLAMGESEMATLLLVAVAPDTGVVETVCAGHPPVVVRQRDGIASLAEGDTGIALGVTTEAEYQVTRSRLEPGDSILLYTDGLVERRGVPLTNGLAELVRAASDAPAAPEAACDALVARFLPRGQSGDDVAMLWLQLQERETAGLDFVVRGSSEDLARARVDLRSWLIRAGAQDDEVEDILLAVSEALATHPQQPGQPPRRLVVNLVGDVVEAVVLASDTIPAPEGTDRGRGFVLMEAMADSFGVQREEGHREVRVVRRLVGGERRDERTKSSVGSVDAERGLVVPGEPTSVPVCRRYVRERLTGADPAVLDAAELCVSELVTNAVVHAGTQTEVRVAPAGAGVRLEIRDESHLLPRHHSHTAGATTGRGLELVSRLSDAWGVEPLPGGGKSVWCEITGGGGPAELDAEDLLAQWGDDAFESMLDPPRASRAEEGVAAGGAEGGEESGAAGAEEGVEPEDGTDPRRVLLLGYPVELGFRAREHGDSLTRECTLLSHAAREDVTGAPERLVMLAEILRDGYAAELADLERQRIAARARGVPRVDLHLPMYEHAAELVQSYQRVLAELDGYAASDALLTPPRHPDVVALHEWMFDEYVAQSRGEPPRAWTGPVE